MHVRKLTWAKFQICFIRVRSSASRIYIHRLYTCAYILVDSVRINVCTHVYRYSVFVFSLPSQYEKYMYISYTLHQKRVYMYVAYRTGKGTQTPNRPSSVHCHPWLRGNVVWHPSHAALTLAHGDGHRGASARPLHADVAPLTCMATEDYLPQGFLEVLANSNQCMQNRYRLVIN